MADGCEREPEASSSALDLVGGMPTMLVGTDMSVATAAEKVAAVMDRLCKLNLDDTPSNPKYAQALEDGGATLLELMDTPALTHADCKIKLGMLDQMATWYQEGDPDITACFKTYSHEVTKLLQRATQSRSDIEDHSSGVVWSKPVRWFLGVASAVPSAIFSRWDSGSFS